MADKTQTGSSSRQMVTIVLLILVVIFVIWQASSFFGGDDSRSASVAKTSSTSESNNMTDSAEAMAMKEKVAAETPKAAMLPKSEAAMQREQALMRIQQETQMSYIAALNQLQMLKVDKDIAETNKVIAKDKLEVVEAQKKIIDLLQPAPSDADATQSAAQSRNYLGEEAIKYTVVAITKYDNTWLAVIAGKDKLFNVRVGDVLPLDQSKVKKINRQGVELIQNNKTVTVSLVPII